MPPSHRTSILTLLHKGRPAINKMSNSLSAFLWPRVVKAIQQKFENCNPCRMSDENIKPNLPKTEINHLPPLSNPNVEIRLAFIGPISDEHRGFYILLSLDRYSKWTAGSFCEIPDSSTAVKFLNQFISLNGISKLIRTDRERPLSETLSENSVIEKLYN